MGFLGRWNHITTKTMVHRKRYDALNATEEVQYDLNYKTKERKTKI